MTTITARQNDLDIFFAACQEQDFENARLTAEGFTGAAHDLTTGDYAVWLRGVRLGWQETKADAEAMVRDQVSRELGREVAAR